MDFYFIIYLFLFSQPAAFLSTLRLLLGPLKSPSAAAADTPRSLLLYKVCSFLPPSVVAISAELSPPKILFPLGKEVLPLITKWRFVCCCEGPLLMWQEAALVYLLKKNNNRLQKLPLRVRQPVRTGGRPRLVETCCQSRPDTMEKGGFFYTLATARLCSLWRFGDARSAGLGQTTLSPARPRRHPRRILHSSSRNGNNFPFIGLYAQVMTAWGTKHLRGCFRLFVPPHPVACPYLMGKTSRPVTDASFY